MYLSVNSCHEGGPYAESGDMGDLVGELVQQTFKYVKYEQTHREDVTLPCVRVITRHPSY